MLNIPVLVIESNISNLSITSVMKDNRNVNNAVFLERMLFMDALTDVWIGIHQTSRLVP